MIANDLLLSYRHITGVERALRGIEGRLQRPSRLSAAVADLRAHYPSLKVDFNLFFPALIAQVAQEKAALANSGETCPAIRRANPGLNPLPNDGNNPFKNIQ